MLQFEDDKGVRQCDGLTRRDFLRVGALGAGAVGLSLADLGAFGAEASKDVNCILLFLVGGPSHLDTFDPKPDAPAEVRGPFRPTRTAVPGLALCEHLPRTARLAEHFAVVRSVHHDEAPIHETGHQLMQTAASAVTARNNPITGRSCRTCAGRAARACRRPWCCRRRWATRASASATARGPAASARATPRSSFAPTPPA